MTDCTTLLRHIRIRSWGRMEVQLVRQLGCTFSEGLSLWRTNLFSHEGYIVQQPIHGRHSERQDSKSLNVSRTGHISALTVNSPRFPHVYSSRLSFLPTPEHASSGLPGGGYSGCPSYRFISGLGCASRIAAAPRVTSFQPDKEWLERKQNEALCPGCGVEMQDIDPKAPGFFQHPAQVKEAHEEEEAVVAVDEFYEAGVPDENDLDREEKEVLLWEGASDPVFDLRDKNDPAESRRARRGRGKNASKGKYGQDKVDLSESERPTVCARCHALRNYGRVKDESVENLLPDFDFEHVVGSRLKKSMGRRAVVLMVIDSVDFDGSFPRTAAALLTEAERELGNSWQEGKAGNVPRLLVVLNKVDLLPGQISPVRLEQWVRRRSRAGGVSHISGVHIVSAFKGWGMEKLSKQIIEMAGPRGDVWVIGAQNVGKSSLINALGRITAEGAERKNNMFLTEAAVPGTTVGILTLEGILPGKARLLDTPGLLHPHQMTTRLTREEQKMVQIRKVLKPRTFRVKVGHALSLGGLMRLTIEKAPADSIYATIWASAFIPCHMGKAETASELFDKHVGEKLQPPLIKERVVDLGKMVARTVQVSGRRWDKSSVDVALAGVGWIALALSGSATLEVWTYEGVAVTIRESIALDLAPVFERPGFTPVKSSGKGKG